jgi:16S rRNA (guanine527-N7)-methyltransferase
VTAAAIEQLRLQSISWGVQLGRAQLSSFNTYADLLAKYSLANIIGTRSRDQIVLEHFIDSVSCFLLEDLQRRLHVIDVGSGAGLPGIPLAIVQPNLCVTLLEPTAKKVRFLEYAVATLGLQNTQVLHARAEEVATQPASRETFALATTRALASLPVILEYCAPLVRPGGVILAMKGRLPEEELSKGTVASQQLGAALREVREVESPVRSLQKERRLVVFDKVTTTHERFPRRVGLAKKRPLGT